MSPVEFKKYPVLCTSYLFSCHKASCRMSIFQNIHGAMMNSGVKGHSMTVYCMREVQGGGGGGSGSE